MKQSVKRDAIKVTLYFSRFESDNMKVAAEYLYHLNAIPRPTLGTYARVAALKMYNEIYNMLAEDKRKLT
jgi:hypothetical protein